MTLEEQIALINATPIKHLTMEVLIVASGRDRFSNLRGVKLWQHIDPDARTAIERHVTDLRFQEKTGRWLLRGVMLDRAILIGCLYQTLSAFHRVERQRQTEEQRAVNLAEFMACADDYSVN